MSDDEVSALVGLFMAYPKHQLAKMLADHDRDATGHCRSCRAAGDSSGRVVDCTLGSAARAAKKRLTEGQAG